MSCLIGFIITTIVVALGLLIISKLPIGVEVDSLGIAIIAAIVFGLLNGFLGWLVAFFKCTILLVPLAWILNVVIFGLTAWLVEGFRLRNGILSAALGALALAIITQVIYYALGRAGIQMAQGTTEMILASLLG
jgi:putative membrane protein